MSPQPGEYYAYTHSKGLGEEARGNALAADMAKLDMPSGTDVKVAFIDDAGWPVVDWIDGAGFDRRTAINPDTFSEFFTKVG
jgi:hypothetical protein